MFLDISNNMRISKRAKEYWHVINGTMMTCGFYGDIIVDFTNGSRSFKPRIGGLAGCRDGGEITGCDMETGVLNLTNLDASKGQRDYAGGRVGQTL